MKKLLVVVGARPNFMKVTRFAQVAQQRGSFHVQLLHTGQHTDDRMSTVFFEQFGMRPGVTLSPTPAMGTARIGHLMVALDEHLMRDRPHAVVVVGDVDSTLAAAIAAKRAGLPLVHVEAGLRNGDRSMPEELNRVLTDRIADHCFTTEASANTNLLREGVLPERIHFVGNTMIDTLVACDERISRNDRLQRMGLGKRSYALVTMHRPVNVDDPERLRTVVGMVQSLAQQLPVVFPVHPRTRSALQRSGLYDRVMALDGLHAVPPMDYIDFQEVLANSRFVLTDSGGVQEETTFRGIPCLTLRESTERPVTVEVGTNRLVDFEMAALRAAVERVMLGGSVVGAVPEKWDGRATERIFDVLERVL